MYNKIKKEECLCGKYENYRNYQKKHRDHVGDKVTLKANGGRRRS